MQFVELFVDKCPVCSGLSKFVDWNPEEGLDKNLAKFICDSCKLEYYKYLPIVLDKEDRQNISIASCNAKVENNMKKNTVILSTETDSHGFRNIINLYDTWFL